MLLFKACNNNKCVYKKVWWCLIYMYNKYDLDIKKCIVFKLRKDDVKLSLTKLPHKTSAKTNIRWKRKNVVI